MKVHHFSRGAGRVARFGYFGGLGYPQADAPAIAFVDPSKEEYTDANYPGVQSGPM